MTMYFDTDLDMHIPDVRHDELSLPTPPVRPPRPFSFHTHSTIQDSNDGTPFEETPLKIHVSTMFYPGSPLDGGIQGAQDLVLVSNGPNSVFFYVHSSKLLEGSSNQFNGLLADYAKQKYEQDTSFSAFITPDPTTSKASSSSSISILSSFSGKLSQASSIPNSPAPSITSTQTSPATHTQPLSQEPKLIPLHESAETLNVLLHTLYGLDCSHYSPTLTSLAETIESLQTYGYDLESVIAYKRPLYMQILSYAPSKPLEVYALAARWNLEGLAIASSSHLLSFNLPSLTDEACMMMGPVYLKKLFFLHLGRTAALKVLPSVFLPSGWD
jgi:hypothetical protein